MRRALLSLLVGLCACTSAPEPAAVVPEPGPEGAQRVVVIDPGVTEVMIALDAVDRMIGRPSYTDSLTETVHLPDLGTGLSPVYEQIVRGGPDLILTTHASRGTVLDNLRKIAPTENLPWLTATEVAGSIRTIGDRLAMKERASTLASELEAALQPTAGADAPRVLVLLGAPTETDTDLWVVKPNSLHGAALLAAGGQHAITAEIAGPPTLSIEGLLQIDPDVIVVLIADTAAASEAEAATRSFWARLTMLKAVRSGRVGVLIGQSHFSTGPGILRFKDALQAEIARTAGAQP